MKKLIAILILSGISTVYAQTNGTAVPPPVQTPPPTQSVPELSTTFKIALEAVKEQMNEAQAKFVAISKDVETAYPGFQLNTYTGQLMPKPKSVVPEVKK